jgi:DNA polymerase (family 10)
VSHNDEVAARFEEFASLLEAKEIEYKPRSYRRAAENVRGYPEPIENLASEGEAAVQEIEGIGDAIAAKIVEYVETGEIEELAELRADLPVDMAGLTNVEGVGPKTVGTLYRELGIEDLDGLEAAAEAGEIEALSGFGAKTEANIRSGIAFARTAQQRQRLGEVRPLGEDLVSYLDDVEAAERCALGGSLRRWRATVGDLDVLCASDDPEAVVERFTDWDRADSVIESGSAKASVRSDGTRIDLRVVASAEFGSALQYFTGSRDHNIGLRNRAIARDLKINEYGVFDVSNVENPDNGQRVGERVAGETDASVYEAVSLPPIPPELREDRGEIAAAADGRLPDLVAEGDVRGDLHVHSAWSDGANTVSEMVRAAAEFGHEYVCCTDHASGPGIPGGTGLSDEELREQTEEIEAVREEVADEGIDIEVPHGVEANIDADGGISVGDDVLADLDLVVASPHSGLDGDGTDRIVEAISHPAVTIVGHPTGRQLGRRPGMDLDFDAVAEAAAEHGTALEVNANPQRLDLGGSAVKAAIDAGATIAIDTDAHQPANFSLLRYGVHTARRGWVEAEDVCNAWPYDELRAFLDG